MEELQGGQFGHGFANAGLSAVLSPAIDQIGNPVVGTVVSAIVGGTGSSLSGGKFANGAITASFSYAFGAIARKAESLLDGIPSVVDGKSPENVIRLGGPGYETYEEANFAAYTAYDSAYLATGPSQELIDVVVSVDGRYYDTSSVLGGEQNNFRLSVPNAPDGATLAGQYHTHPGQGSAYSPEIFPMTMLAMPGLPICQLQCELHWEAH